MRGDNPDGVYQPRDVAQKSQQDIQPELQAKADLEEHVFKAQVDSESQQAVTV